MCNTCRHGTAPFIRTQQFRGFYEKGNLDSLHNLSYFRLIVNIHSADIRGQKYLNAHVKGGGHEMSLTKTNNRYPREPGILPGSNPFPLLEKLSKNTTAHYDLPS